MPSLAQDRLVRKEVALGLVREFEPPQDHMGLQLLAPWMDVASDDVIFDYTRGFTAGLAPARAEDAESELAGKDDSVGTGRAAIIDWAIKDHYSASDVTRYREGLILGQIAGAENFPLAIKSMTDEWQTKLVRDAQRKRRMLDNRWEWMIMSALQTGAITYNDGKIIFTVDFGRPSAQTDAACPSGQYWSSTTADIIGDIQSVDQYMYDLYGCHMGTVVISSEIARQMHKSDKWTNTLVGSNPLYMVDNWGPEAARRRIENQTGVNFIVYDAVYRTRALGSNTTVNTRFLNSKKAYFLPSDADIAAIDDMIGFGKMLTSPHPEGNWSAGYYEWERSTVDPWGYDVGVGCKAFPVLPHMDKTYTMQVLAP